MKTSPLDAFPHDLVHDLVSDLQWVTYQIFESIERESTKKLALDHEGAVERYAERMDRLGTYLREADTRVSKELERWRPLIDSAWITYVEPRIAAYVNFELSEVDDDDNPPEHAP